VERRNSFRFETDLTLYGLSKSLDSPLIGEKANGVYGMAKTQMSERESLDLWRRSVCASVRSDAPDLTARQQAILMTVSLTRGPHTVRGLAGLLDIAKPAVTRALDTLTGQGLVKRVKDESDLRNVFIERTPQGAAYLRALAGMISKAAAGEEPGADTKAAKRAA